MQANERRNKILTKLQNSKNAISATVLAKEFMVSRQIVVGDIALLRATGEEITATPKGYLLVKKKESAPENGIIKKIACIHSGEKMQTELQICIDNGCSVLDVIVEHPVYGQLTGALDLHSRYDIEQFIKKVESEDAHALSELTDGIHLHTLHCPSEATYQRVCECLEAEGILLKPQD